VKREEQKQIRAIRNGNLEEFEKLFRMYYETLLNYAGSILKDENDAEEIVQNLFFNFWKNRESLEINSSLKSYLYRAVYNNCLQHLKHLKVRMRYEQHVKNYAEESIDPMEELKHKELQEKIYRLLDELPERCQTIFKLNRFDGLKYQEIADKLSISIKTVEANISKALKHFRKSLGEYVGNVQ